MVKTSICFPRPWCAAIAIVSTKVEKRLDFHEKTYPDNWQWKRQLSKPEVIVR
jgi:hypothetical protein